MPSSNLLLDLLFGIGVLGWAVRIGAVLVVPVNRRPSSATAWLMLIMLLPYIGLFLFFLIGNPKLPRKRREKQRRANERISELTEGMASVPPGEPGPSWIASLAQLNRNLGAMPMLAGNHGRLIEDYNGGILEMAADIDKAERYVHVAFYILGFDETTAPFFKALEDAKARGCEVRVLFDHIGTKSTPTYKATCKELDRIGVEWHRMLPVLPLKGKYQRPDLRNHRKLLMIDGTVGYMGSQNMIDRSYNKKSNIKRGLQWQELIVRLEGPIVVGMGALFQTDWFSETDETLGIDTDLHVEPADLPGSLGCQIVPSGPGFDGDNNLKMFNCLFYNAERRVSITSPYFVPDESLIQAVTTCAERGVEVELFVSEIGDQPLVYHAQQSYYEVLLRAGVRIFMYPPPYILHSKHLSIDDDIAVIGSSNMDMRSFELNLESTLLVSGKSFTDDLRAVEDHYRSISKELTLEAHLSTGYLKRALDNLARLTSALQ